MEEKISLPGGGWALLRDPEMVTEGQRRPVDRLQAKINASALGGVFVEKAERLARGDKPEDVDKWLSEESRRLMGSDEAAMIDDRNDMIVGVLVESWSFEGDPSADAALKLPHKVYEALKDACVDAWTGTAVTVDPAQHRDEQSPTEPSTD